MMMRIHLSSNSNMCMVVRVRVRDDDDDDDDDDDADSFVEQFEHASGPRSEPSHETMPAWTCVCVYVSFTICLYIFNLLASFEHEPVCRLDAYIYNIYIYIYIRYCIDPSRARLHVDAQNTLSL
jgi:hypothetical protein